MAKREYLQRHLLIIQQLKKKPCSFEEIRSVLLEMEYIFNENLDISLRTFQRDLKEICEFFGTEITYNKSIGKYEIVEEFSTSYERIFESFEVLTALKLSNKMGNKIILERKADRGTEHLQGILYAIDHQFLVTFTHQSYEYQVVTERKVLPLYVKEAQHRWYLICWDVEKNGIRNFGLDRISKLQITNQKGPQNIPNAREFYQHAVGIETYHPAETVVIRCSEKQAPYLQTLPLHLSQQMDKNEDGYCYFSVYVHPTHEFKMEVFKYMNLIEVVSPAWFREEIATEIKHLSERYGV